MENKIIWKKVKRTDKIIEKKVFTRSQDPLDFCFWLDQMGFLDKDGNFKWSPFNGGKLFYSAESRKGFEYALVATGACRYYDHEDSHFIDQADIARKQIHRLLTQYENFGRVSPEIMEKGKEFRRGIGLARAYMSPFLNDLLTRTPASIREYVVYHASWFKNCDYVVEVN